MFADPVKNLRSFGLEGNNVVADLGAGTGFYAVAAGKMVPHGKVYAVEVQKDFLTKIKHKVADARLGNVEIIWGDVEKRGGTKIRDRVVDAVIASNILFQVAHKDAFLEEIKRILKPEGRVLLVDWSDRSSLVHLGDTLILKDKAREMFEEKGFKWERDIDAGEHHYGMILRKKGE